MNMRLLIRDRIRIFRLNQPVLLPILVAALLSFLRLDSNSLWLDEGYSIYIAKLSWPGFWDIISHSEGNMAPHYALLKLWVNVFGDSEFAIRSLSAILGIGGVIMTYAIGASLFDQRTALAAGLILATNAFFIIEAQDGRGYTLSLLIVTSSMYLMIRALQTQESKYYLWLGLTNALALYAHFFGSFVLISQFVFLLSLPRGKIRWRKMLVSATITAILALPLGVYLITQDPPPMGWIQKPSLPTIYYLFKDFTGGKILVICYFIACLLCAAFIIRKRMHLRQSQLLWRYAMLMIWLFVPILGVYLLSMFKPFFIPRYMFTSLPALVLLTAAGLSSLKPKPLYLLALSSIILLSLHAVVVDVYNPERRDNWRSAVRYVLQNAKPGDAIFFYSGVGKIPFEYYYGQSSGPAGLLTSVYPSSFGVFSSAKAPNPSINMIESLGEKHDRLWLVLYLDRFEGMGWDSRTILPTIQQHYSEQQAANFQKVNVRLYQR